MGLTRDLGAFVSGTTFERLPREAVDIVALGFTDCIGTMIAGRDDPAVAAVRQVFVDSFQGNGAGVCFTMEKAPAPVAALINGTAAHALDYDDVALLGHPSAVLVPAILAEAQELDRSGAAMITAYVVGYETWAELIRRERGHYRGKGWHPTAVFGAVAAAAASASLRSLDATRVAHALGIAASRAGGLTANFGSMTKPLHVGQAAQSGLMAARLAAAGLTASRDALEHAQGFLAAISPTGEPDRTSPANDLGRSWRILERGLSVKRYPVCYAIHRAIDAMLGLCTQVPFYPESVARITVSLSRAQDAMLRHARPTTSLEAKFSAEFGMAAAILTGGVGLADLSDAFVMRSDVQTMIERVEKMVHDTYDPDLPDYAPFDFVEVQLENGDRLTSEKVRRAKGHTSNPLSREELCAKFEDCVGRVLPPDRRTVLFEALQGLAAMRSARQLESFAT